MAIETAWQTRHMETVRKAEKGAPEPTIDPYDAELEKFDFASLTELMQDSATPHEAADFNPQPKKIADYLGVDMVPARDAQGNDINGNEHIIFFTTDGKDVVKIDRIRTDEYTRQERLLVHEVTRNLVDPDQLPEMKRSFLTEYGSGIVVKREYPDDEKVEKEFTIFERTFKEATGLDLSADDTKKTNYMPVKGKRVLIDDLFHVAEDYTDTAVQKNVRRYMDKKTFSDDRADRVTRGIRALTILQEAKPPTTL